MSTFQLVKSMTRSLTEEEQEAIIKFWQENQELTENQVIEHWEKKLGMPVTRTALMMAMINFGD
jgi:hypothetical protein